MPPGNGLHPVGLHLPVRSAYYLCFSCECIKDSICYIAVKADETLLGGVHTFLNAKILKGIQKTALSSTVFI